eukprot:CAMPEP_0119512620 /NCGR_PEP_ID=MMETSP1344-20130328/30954_1 /TAXON_ID=236787 /ORGANISM="Florenciella parvula, Strain CCMP2471" /LENGTH=48 /DNA_ID= /DNA_START= /DNA_END= /DNA_ORIENTATION=
MKQGSEIATARKKDAMISLDESGQYDYQLRKALRSSNRTSDQIDLLLR